MSVSLLDLWMPILLGGILAWLASAVVHTVLKYHNSDYQKLTNEDEVGAVIAKGGAAPGFYSFPHCVDMKEMQDEGMQKRFEQGPVGMLAVMPNGMPPMGKLIGQQVVYSIAACVLIAYCASMALAPGADYLTVFRFVAAVGFLTFGWAVLPFSIWYGHPWSTSAKYLFDAAIYGLLVGGAFGWLWPAAA
ncbi:MAG: hypothetical protein HKN70_06995 [Gammaproteobacteria bacterium]|nr:hypothetical protein [Gammaproteobacteria bacterium]